MYKVVYTTYKQNQPYVLYKWFTEQQDALIFARGVPILEIKYYESSDNN